MIETAKFSLSKTALARVREAKQILVQLHALGLVPSGWTLEAWVALGTELWEHSYKEHKTDCDALTALGTWVDTELHGHPLLRVLEQILGRPGSTQLLVRALELYPDAKQLLLHKIHMELPDEQTRYFWLARWVDQGCPRVLIDPKYAALLMATDVGKSAVEHIIPPWHAFLIELPTDLLSVEGEDKRSDAITRILVQSVINIEGKKICHMIGIGETVALWRHNCPLSDLAQDTDTAEEQDWSGLTTRFTDRDDRIVTLMGRLVISTCVALMDSGNYHRQKPKGSHVNRRKAKGLTEIQTFVLGKPIKINCRQAILDYLDGTGKKRGPVTVQSIVRGHWKHQHHGPGRALRKFIHIEPYWRGPEDAKVLTRVVELETPERPS